MAPNSSAMYYFYFQRFSDFEQNSAIISFFCLLQVGLPTDFPLMPGLLQELGYEAHGLGKWHLGYCSPEYLPNNRYLNTSMTTSIGEH